MTSNLAIIGAGGFGRETLELARASNAVRAEWNVLGFIVDPEFAQPGTDVDGVPILGGFDWLAENHAETRVVCAIGQPEVRLRMVERAMAVGAKFATLIHPTAIIGSRVRWGNGVIVNAGSVLTTNVQLGDHVQVHIASCVSHDVSVERYATLSPGVRLSGNVRVGEGAYLGTGATVVQRLSIGSWSIVGAGCVATKNVPDDSTVVGVPGRVHTVRANGWHRS